MTWWAWIAVFLLILAIGGGFIALETRKAWRSFKALNADVRELNLLVSALESHRERLTEARAEPRLAVFERPAAMRRERRLARQTLAEQRRARREATLPGWARR